MNWNSEKGQALLSVAYALQDNKSNAARRARENITKLVTQRVYAKYDYELGMYVYALQPFEYTENTNIEQRGYSKRVGGRKPIADEVITKMNTLRSEGLPVRKIASLLQVGTGTVCKYTQGQEKE